MEGKKKYLYFKYQNKCKHKYIIIIIYAIIIFDLDYTLVNCKMKIPRQTYHMLNKFKKLNYIIGIITYNVMCKNERPEKYVSNKNKTRKIKKNYL